MSEGEKSTYERLLDQATNPWDLAMGGAGAAIGIGVTFVTAGLDMGTSAATGFVTGITARKTLVAFTQRRRLRRRAMALRDVFEAQAIHNSLLKSLVEELNLELSLWESRAISDDNFAKQMDKLTNKLRENLPSKNTLLSPTSESGST